MLRKYENKSAQASYCHFKRWLEAYFSEKAKNIACHHVCIWELWVFLQTEKQKPKRDENT
ncbi:MAG TPA: hypothetical protein DEQ84_02315 [Prevotellaceae bacterium]|nr:hypothetical protein [Prevotellaceae bacterium]